MDQDATWYEGIPLGPGHIVLDGNSATQKGHSPQLSAYFRCGQTAGWTKIQDANATWWAGTPRPRRHCVTRGLNSPQKGA